MLQLSLSISVSVVLPGSRSSGVLEVARTGNTGVSGQWLFRVDGEQVTLPGEQVTQSLPTIGYI